MSGYSYYWDKQIGSPGSLVRARLWTGHDAEMWSSGTWHPYGIRLDLEGMPITEAAARRYMAGGSEPTGLDCPDRRPLHVSEAKAAADALAEEEWPGLEGVRALLADYVEQFEGGEADDLPEDPDPGQEG